MVLKKPGLFFPDFSDVPTLRIVKNQRGKNLGRSDFCRTQTFWSWFLRSESCRTKVSPDFAPNFAPNFPRIFRGCFVLRSVGNGDQKKFIKNPRHFSMQNSQANTKKIFTKCFCSHDFPRTFLTLTPTTWAAGKRTCWCGRPRFSLGRHVCGTKLPPKNF